MVMEAIVFILAIISMAQYNPFMKLLAVAFFHPVPAAPDKSCYRAHAGSAL
jgi:hypothetical protein